MNIFLKNFFLFIIYLRQILSKRTPTITNNGVENENKTIFDNTQHDASNAEDSTSTDKTKTKNSIFNFNEESSDGGKLYTEEVPDNKILVRKVNKNPLVKNLERSQVKMSLNQTIENFETEESEDNDEIENRTMDRVTSSKYNNMVGKIDNLQANLIEMCTSLNDIFKTLDKEILKKHKKNLQFIHKEAMNVQECIIRFHNDKFHNITNKKHNGNLEINPDSHKPEPPTVPISFFSKNHLKQALYPQTCQQYLIIAHTKVEHFFGIGYAYVLKLIINFLSSINVSNLLFREAHDQIEYISTNIEPFKTIKIKTKRAKAIYKKVDRAEDAFLKLCNTYNEQYKIINKYLDEIEEDEPIKIHKEESVIKKYMQYILYILHIILIVTVMVFIKNTF
ncbi:hypothetical protein SLOPH_617 [Spraguea lophii 42_110]|uniref:Uncharacterized protein n=1 Tax=Spraguea lophii (strain 42_110) TaxID=1358809 RepID=S7WEF4_SPRLO|nr:hypothetical protein SLOPH_617 [Spraguea lophii 42_110]